MISSPALIIFLSLAFPGGHSVLEHTPPTSDTASVDAPYAAGYECQDALDAYKRGDYKWFDSDVSHNVTGNNSITFDIGQNNCVMVVPSDPVRVQLNSENDTQSAPYSFPAVVGGNMQVSNVDQSSTHVTSVRVLQHNSSVPLHH
jgi:hypothetical protein